MVAAETKQILNQKKGFLQVRPAMRVAAGLDHVGLGEKSIDKSVPRVWVAIEKDGSIYTYEGDRSGKVLGTAHLRKGKEKASYPIGKILAEHFIGGGEKGNLVLQPVENEIAAEMILQGFEDSEHTVTPIGTVLDPNTNRLFLVCQTRGKGIRKLSLSKQEKLEFSKAIVKRLAALHTEDIGCGGLSPDAVVLEGGSAKVKNMGKLFRLTESDSPFFEAVATLRSIVGKKMAGRGDLPSLASVYHHHSPVSRSILVSRLKEKGKAASDESAKKELVDAAVKYASLFQN